MLVRVHANALVLRAFHAEMQIGQDHKPLWRAHLFQPAFQQRFAEIGAETGPCFQDGSCARPFEGLPRKPVLPHLRSPSSDSVRKCSRAHTNHDPRYVRAGEEISFKAG